jgi:hypothetical protein
MLAPLFADDAGSLDRLHDIVVPGAVPFWPPAPAWYAVGIIGLALLAVGVWKAVDWWLRNGYRRAGLAELLALEGDGAQSSTTSQVASIVKRVALVAYSRERVASLTGEAWLRFLDATRGTHDFIEGPGRLLEAGYEPGRHAASAELFAAVRHWITHHRTD